MHQIWWVLLQQLLHGWLIKALQHAKQQLNTVTCCSTATT